MSLSVGASQSPLLLVQRLTLPLGAHWRCQANRAMLVGDVVAVCGGCVERHGYARRVAGVEQGEERERTCGTGREPDGATQVEK